MDQFIAIRPNSIMPFDSMNARVFEIMVMIQKGYTRENDWTTLLFEGADLNEVYWQKRLSIPMEFILSGLKE